MNKKFILTLFVLLTVLSVSACSSLDVQKNLGGTTSIDRTINVNGTGSVTLTPDIASISIGVYTEQADAAQAMTENNEKVSQVMAVLEAAGVAESDITTTNLSVYPQTRYDDMGNQTGTTYNVQNTVQVIVRDLDKIGELLNEAVNAGANNIYGISFDVEDRESAYAQAMEVAVQNAASRAGILAGASEAELGDVISISSYIYGGGDTQPYMDTALVGKGGGVSVSSGSLEIIAEVNVIYALK